MAQFDVLDKPIEESKFDFKGNMESLNRAFHSKLTPENGIYGVTEKICDDGVRQLTGKDEFNNTFREYYKDGSILRRRENLGHGNVATTIFDDNGTAYARTITKLDKNSAKTISQKLMPETTIVKGNFTAITDAYGRPVINKVTDLQINQSPHGNIPGIVKNGYRVNDQKGHLIAHLFGGPDGPENIVPQTDKVNLGNMKKIENIVRDLKDSGHKVDYEVRTNYADSKSTRPSSFEPKITVDGEEYKELPKELKKIYNDTDITKSKKAITNVKETCTTANELGKKNGLVAAGITMTVSTVDNVSAFIDGEITAEEMVVDIVEDTAVSGAVAYGTTFISTAVSQTMSKSSSALIRSVGGSCAPAAVVSFAVDSYDSISAYAQGEIDGAELAYDLGENAAEVAGGFAGGAMLGSAVGSVAGPVGTVVGGVVGGVVGCVVASEVYETAVELGAEGVEFIAEKAEVLAKETTDFFENEMPDKLDDVKNAFNDFFQSNNLPFSV